MGFIFLIHLCMSHVATKPKSLFVLQGTQFRRCNEGYARCMYVPFARQPLEKNRCLRVGPSDFEPRIACSVSACELMRFTSGELMQIRCAVIREIVGDIKAAGSREACIGLNKLALGRWWNLKFLFEMCRNISVIRNHQKYFFLCPYRVSLLATYAKGFINTNIQGGHFIRALHISISAKNVSCFIIHKITSRRLRSMGYLKRY